MIIQPERFYQRFENGRSLSKNWDRVTSEDSERLFPVRDDGLCVLLINAPIREWSYPNIMPLGQGYVASVAIMDGHRVEVLDLNAERLGPVKSSLKEFDRWIRKKIEEELTASNPDVICIGGIITQYKRIREITRICRELKPETPVVLGGGIASCMPKFMVKRLPIDVAVQEEGEITFSEILHRIEKKQSFEGVLGTVYRHRTGNGDFEVRDNGFRPSLVSRRDGLDCSPWPLRSRWPIDDIYKVNPIGHLNWKNKWKDGVASSPGEFSVAVLGSRGCPYSCDYCYTDYLGKKYRLRGPKDLVDEMEYLQKRYHVSYIHFLDDLLMTDYRWALEFFKELTDRRKSTGFEVMWGGTCRTNIIADDILRARRENRLNILELGYEVGMRQAGYGIESASPKVLKLIDKSGQTPEKMELAIKETVRVLGYADCSFMIGSPGESKESVRETVDFCKRTGLRPEVFFFTTAYPGTEFWALALEKGLIAKAATGTKGPAGEDIIEQYFLKLDEQGETVRTNFSDLPDEEIVELSWSAINESGAQNTCRHPHTGETQRRKPILSR